jgi:tetratricopeptide (TPR) repeat protein
MFFLRAKRTWTLGGLWGGLLILLLGGTAFLLGCFEMLDNDVWWHLRGGEWILQNGRVPDLDPFSFGSADQRWIDLHWLFQVVLALTARAGGLSGVMLLIAAVGAAAFLTALAARPREAPLPIVLLVWLPALVLASNRFDPRPEMFTLLYLAGFLAVLAHVEERPRLAWILPVLQLLWVNMHGLFIFGPIVLGLWWIDWTARLTWRRWSGSHHSFAQEFRPVRHLAAASITVALCCLLNPYGLEGAMFPLRLYPKVAQAGNPYKAYIEEFMSPRQYASLPAALAGTGRWIGGTFHFLLLLVPLGLLLPAVWTAAQFPQADHTERAKPRAEIWLGILLAGVALLLVRVIGLGGADQSGIMVSVGQAVPLLLLAAGVAGAVISRRCLSAGLLCICGALALAAWSAWLGDYLGGKPLDSGQAIALLAGAAVAGALCAALVMLHGGSLFSLLLAAAFSYLALKAVNSFARFALISGVLLAGSLGTWVGRLLADWPVASRPAATWMVRLGMLVLLAGFFAAVASERYTRWTGDIRHLALRERPLTFAHDAARFAGQPGMPRRALVFDIAQSCVFVYHNAPDRKVYMDARLETPTETTFRHYVDLEKWLNKPDARWADALEQMGNPVLMLSHAANEQAEAAVLAHPGWRCVYVDALASVFVHRGDAELERRFPTVDPLARHFHQSRAPSHPEAPGAAWMETKALYNLATSLRKPGSLGWDGRIPWLLAALDRAELALEEDPESAKIWTVLGNCHWNLIPDLGQQPPSPSSPWDATTGLAWAQSTYCFRQALERAPNDERVLQALLRSFGVRRMADAQRDIALRLLATGQLRGEQTTVLRRLVERVGPTARSPSAPDVSRSVPRLLQAGRPAQAVRLAEEAGMPRGESAWPWPLADALAGAWMHLGQPERARALWRKALGPPSEAVRLERLASTHWVERDFAEAVRLYRQAWKADPRRVEPGWALAWLHTQRGEAEPALHACRETLRLSPPARLREELSRLEQLLRSVPSVP